MVDEHRSGVRVASWSSSEAFVAVFCDEQSLRGGTIFHGSALWCFHMIGSEDPIKFEL